jgi:nucleotide-binding universal stress UspA family protein
MYNRILVPLDGSKLAECVLPHVELIAKGCGAKEIVFFRVWEPLQVWSGKNTFKNEADIQQWNDSQKAEAEDYLMTLVENTCYDGIKITSDTMSGRPAQTITEYAAKNKIDMIIIANHGCSGPSQMFTGNVASKLIQNPRTPILMVNTPDVFMGD